MMFEDRNMCVHCSGKPVEASFEWYELCENCFDSFAEDVLDLYTNYEANMISEEEYVEEKKGLSEEYRVPEEKIDEYICDYLIGDDED